MNYVGRFAPSPTGPLHFGSLAAALASYLDARAKNGAWLLRIEDLDPPRESPEAPGQIINQLRAFGLAWDGDILYQSTRLPAYQEALDTLAGQGHTYLCTCTRRHTPAVYPGTCRDSPLPAQGTPSAVRVRLPGSVLTTEDLRLGHLEWQPDAEVGDFVIRRKDGLFAYQLAVVVDDIFQQVTHVIRGIDLLDSTPRQLALYDLLGCTPPSFMHIPIIVDRDQVKLSKQTHATPVTTGNPVSTLREVLVMLGQNPQAQARNVPELLAAAIDNWDTSRLPESNELTVPAIYR